MSGQGTRLGRYLLGERIAVGGMGEVFVATQSGLGGFEKPLVIKMMLPHLAQDPAAVEMFLHEARVAARFRHPNLVQIFDVGVDTGRYFISMELIEGVSLHALIHGLAAHGEALEPELFFHVARGLAAALDHAHSQRGDDGSELGLVHRDVSPQNVLVSREGEVKLTDFGIAKLKGAAGRTEPGMIKGKFEYIAPESVAGHAPVDARADLFAAALTLVHLATGTSPFRRANELETLKAVVREPLPSLAAARPDLPAAVIDALTRCAAKQPTERLPSARALGAAFPAPGGDAPARLGQLISRVCRAELSGLMEKTVPAAAAPSTEDLELKTPGSASRPARRGLRAVALGAAAILGGAVVAAALAVFGSSGTPAPSIVAEVVPPAPQPAPVPEPPPTAPASPPQQPAPPERVAKRNPPRPAVRANEAPALLSIDATPWAHVSIGGTLIGDTPIASYPVTAREVTIVFTSDEPGRRKVRKVKTQPGQRLSVHEDLR